MNDSNLSIEEYVSKLYEKSIANKYSTEQLIEYLELPVLTSDEVGISCLNKQSQTPPWEKETTEEIIAKTYDILFNPDLEFKDPIEPPENLTVWDAPDPWNYIWTADKAFILLQQLPESKNELLDLLNTAQIKYITTELHETVLYKKEWLFDKDWTSIEMWAEKNNPYYIYCTSHYDDTSVCLAEEF